MSLYYYPKSPSLRIEYLGTMLRNDKGFGYRHSGEPPLSEAS